MRCGDFSPDTCCLTLQLKVSVITLRRKSARRSIVYLIPYVENFQSASEQTKIAEQEILARLQIMEEEQISYKRYCLNCTRYRRSNGSPTDFVGNGFWFSWGRATARRWLDDRVRSFTRADDKGSSRCISDYESEVFIHWNVVIRHKSQRSDHLTTIVVVFLCCFARGRTEKANRYNFSEDVDRSAWWMLENDIGLKITAKAVADLCDSR